MGLDVIAYSKLKKVNATHNEDGDAIDAVTREPLTGTMSVWVNTHFPGRADGLEDGGVYTYEREEHMRAGSYSGYNQWRERLAELSGWPFDQERGLHVGSAWAADGGPFWELLNFSDCEGTLGTAVCQKLAKDFAENEDAIIVACGKMGSNGRYWEQEEWISLYRGWRSLFELASDGGCVDFH